SALDHVHLDQQQQSSEQNLLLRRLQVMAFFSSYMGLQRVIKNGSIGIFRSDHTKHWSVAS
ncbi:hypothetical protein ACLBO7_29795, partial [Klebsiella pneumoniae]